MRRALSTYLHMRFGLLSRHAAEGTLTLDTVVHDTDGEDFSVPYSGPPFSLYNTNSITISQSGSVSVPGIYYDLPVGTRVWIKDLLQVNSTMKYGSAGKLPLEFNII